jgi:hypothetical protein
MMRLKLGPTISVSPIKDLMIFLETIFDDLQLEYLFLEAVRTANAKSRYHHGSNKTLPRYAGQAEGVSRAPMD